MLLLHVQTNPIHPQTMRTSRFAIITLVVAVCAVGMLGASGIGYRQGLWALRPAFTVLTWAAYLGFAASVVAIVGLIVSRANGGATMATFGVALAIGALTGFLPWRWRTQAQRVPPIHDITTDMQDPPLFVAILPLRATAKNPVGYGGDSVAALQRAGYPDIVPLRFPTVPAITFANVRAAATAMEWELVAADSASGRLEATATTRWFGFKDDVVVRVRADGSGSRVDVRSLSRIGGSDVGTNAARIRAFAARLPGRIPT